MVEAKAWLYTKGDAWTVTKERTTVIYQPISGYPHSGAPHYDFTETPLYGPEALAERDALIAEQAKEIERLASLSKANNDLARMEVAYRKQLAFQRAEMANALEAVTSQYGDRLPAQFLADLTAMLMRPALRAGAVVEKTDV